MTLSWSYAAASDVGLLREGNEDSAFAGSRLLAVADGMGGHAAGEVASAAVIAALEQLDELGVNAGDPQEALREAVQEANANLRLMVAADSELQGMGTTITAVLSDGRHTWLAHIGDSRAYLLRDGDLRQLTRDHTFVQQLVDEGRIAPEDASTHPQRNFITRALDGRESIEIDLDRIDLEPGDRLLLCSDGLTGVVSDESMAEVLRTSSPDEAVQRLVDLALRGGGPDNITCIVADAVDASVTDGAVVAGAASDGATKAAAAPGVRNPDSAATRAATLRRRPPNRDDADGPDPRDRARRIRRRRALVVTAAVLLLLGVGGGVGWSWTRSQYYVGVAGEQVAVYRGIEGTLAGIDLSKVDRTLPLRADELPPFERKRVEDGIRADDRREADEIVARLANAALPPCPTPVATPTAPAVTPSRGAVTPTPAPSRPATPTRIATPTPSPTPSAAPSPAPCRSPGLP